MDDTPSTLLVAERDEPVRQFLALRAVGREAVGRVPGELGRHKTGSACSAASAPAVMTRCS